LTDTKPNECKSHVICIRLVLCQSKDVNLCCIDEDVFIRLHGPHVMVWPSPTSPN